MGRTRTMGYDFATTEADPDEEGMLLSLAFSYQDAIRERSAAPRTGAYYLAAQTTMEDLLVEVDRAERSTYHLTLWEMRTIRQQMREAGMLDLTVLSPVEPNPETYGVDAEMLQLDYPEFPEELVPEALRAYQTERRTMRERTAPAPGGIAFYKLCSNDNWLITPAEIEPALAAAAAGSETGSALDRFPDRTWRDWINYLTYAATHGGCRVA